MKTPRLRGFGGLTVFFLCSSVYAASVDDPAMAGSWSGTAEIVVNWTTQRVLPVDLVIASNGSVTGKIGDATLSGGELKRNRGWLGRALKVKTDYLVFGELHGDVIAAEGIRREGRVMLPLHWTDNRFTGSVHTSGTKFGDKKTMVLSARHVRLERNKAAP